MQTYKCHRLAISTLLLFMAGALILGLLPLAACAAAESLRVVTDNNYPPYLFLNADGRPEGYLVDLWALWEKKTGVHVDLAPMQWSAAQKEISNGKADVIELIFQTPERENLYRFSPPYSTQKAGIYVDHTINGIHNADSLRGFQIGVELGDICIDKLHSLGINTLRLYPNYGAILAAARTGVIKMFCMNDGPADYYLYQSGDHQRFGKAFTLYTEHLHWAVRRGDDARFAMISQGMNRITPQEYEALRKRWFTRSVKFEPYVRVAMIAALVALGALSLSAIWIRSLRKAVQAKTSELRGKNDALERQSRELVVQHAELRAIIESSPDSIWLKGRDGLYVDCNAKATALCGRTREDIIGRPSSEVMPGAALVAKLRQLDERAWASGVSQQSEFTLTAPDGSVRHLDLIKVPVLGPDGHMTRVLGVARDVTERKRLEQELRIAAVAFESQDGIVISDAQDIIQRVNSAFTELTGYAAEEVVGRTPADLLGPGMNAAVSDVQLGEAIALEGSWNGPVLNRKKDGSLILVRIAASAVRDERGILKHIVRSLHDITAEAAAIERAERLTKFDLLTDLPNRTMVEWHVTETAMRAAADTACCRAILIIGLDDFTTVNSAYDHKVGDRILQEAAHRMRNLTPTDGILGRVSSDLFALHLPRLEQDPIAAAQRANRIAHDIRSALAQPYVIERAGIVSCTASIGIAVDSNLDRSADTLFKEAEIAMLKAKSSGKNAVCLFEARMQQEIDARNALAKDLRAGLSAGQFALHYQPQVDGNGKVVGAEALLRWRHPKYGMVPPDQFIPVAEQTGLIELLGGWVMDQACRQVERWAAGSLTHEIILAVNVSVRQFRQPDFVRQIESTIVETGADPRKLKLEITESMVMDDIDDAVAKLDTLKHLGLRISLDDFGTGSSSLSYLTRLSPHQIKIDKSFVRKLPDSRNDALVTQTIVGMAQGLGLEVVAEGVETSEQYRFLRTLGCDLYQGYLFGKPFPPEEFEATLARGSLIRAEN
jgi:diguanylate cyclase (GGDEF)-like protein/PAS domain S-box-containing protein